MAMATLMSSPARSAISWVCFGMRIHHADVSERIPRLFVIRAHVFTPPPDVALASKRLHLGKAGQYEWEEYRDRPVDAERLELRFEAKANPAEQTLRIWQRDVKLRWMVLLNGRKLGTLTTAETVQECVLAV